MKTTYPLIFNISFVCLSCATKKPKSDTVFNTERPKENWQSIFIGNDLEGLTMKISGYPLGENFKNTFRVENGLSGIGYDGYGDGLNERF